MNDNDNPIGLEQHGLPGANLESGSPAITLPPPKNGHYRVADLPEILANALHPNMGARDVIVGRHVRRGVRYFHQTPSAPIPYDGVDPEDFEANEEFAKTVTWADSHEAEVTDHGIEDQLDRQLDSRYGLGASRTPSKSEVVVEEIKHPHGFIRDLTLLNSAKKYEPDLLPAILSKELGAVDPDTKRPPFGEVSELTFRRLCVTAEALRAWLSRSGLEVAIPQGGEDGAGNTGARMEASKGARPPARQWPGTEERAADAGSGTPEYIRTAVMAALLDGLGGRTKKEWRKYLSRARLQVRAARRASGTGKTAFWNPIMLVDILSEYIEGFDEEVVRALYRKPGLPEPWRKQWKEREGQLRERFGP